MARPKTSHRFHALITILTFTIFAAFFLGKDTAYAQSAPKPEFTLQMVGNTRVMVGWKVLEWFAQEAEARSNGRVKIQLASSPELGMTGFERFKCCSKV